LISRIFRSTCVTAALMTAVLAMQAGPVGASAAGPTSAPARNPIYMPNVQNIHNPALVPPPVKLPPVCFSAPSPVGTVCVPYNVPPAGQPAPVNMAYFGGHVQVQPKIYMILWGWGQAGAFDHTVAGQPPNDPDGAGAQMVAFAKALGGTQWAGEQTQYFQIVGGVQQNIQNPANQFGGVWNDDVNPIHNNVTGLELAQEAQKAVAHFGVTDLKNSQFVIAQPQKFNEAGFNSAAGYCAWHDYTQQQYYPGVQEGIAFTNMPYVLNSAAGCGQNSVNAGSVGLLDGTTIVLGHEIEETVTDPGAEDVINGANLGGWFDYSGYENGDKCAWVGYLQVTQTNPNIPGSMNNITGNDGKKYAVQSLWSNNAAGGLGYCAGAGTDLPF
jgi:hypothetical protein